MDAVEYIGFVAGSLIALSLLPQVIKSWKTQSTKDIALPWILINLSGQVLWVIYGVFILSYALIVMSSITLAMTMVLIGLKLSFG